MKTTSVKTSRAANIVSTCCCFPSTVRFTRVLAHRHARTRRQSADSGRPLPRRRAERSVRSWACRLGEGPFVPSPERATRAHLQQLNSPKPSRTKQRCFEPVCAGLCDGMQEGLIATGDWYRWGLRKVDETVDSHYCEPVSESTTFQERRAKQGRDWERRRCSAKSLEDFPVRLRIRSVSTAGRRRVSEAERRTVYSSGV